MRPPVPNPCSLYDEWLSHYERDLSEANPLTLTQLQAAVRNLVTTLRAHERDRVMRIMDQI
jgi:hypothetical protein